MIWAGALVVTGLVAMFAGSMVARSLLTRADDRDPCSCESCVGYALSRVERDTLQGVAKDIAQGRWGK